MERIYVRVTGYARTNLEVCGHRDWCCGQRSEWTAPSSYEARGRDHDTVPRGLDDGRIMSAQDREERLAGAARDMVELEHRPRTRVTVAGVGRPRAAGIP